MELGVHVQVKSVPVISEVKGIAVLLLLQISFVSGLLFRFGVGNTFTTKSMESPKHPFATGNSLKVTVYVTVPSLNNR